MTAMMGTMSIVEAVIVAVLVVWLGLTVVGQFVRNPNVWRKDPFSIIPRWAFFVGGSIADYSLLFRDRLVDGSYGPWREAPFVRRRVWWHVFFNPASRCRRVGRVLIVQTLSGLHTGAAAGAHENPHCRALMRAALSFPPTAEARAREAIIVRTFGLISNRVPEPIVRLALQSVSTGQTA
jgi:hypothetical protein